MAAKVRCLDEGSTHVPPRAAPLLRFSVLLLLPPTGTRREQSAASFGPINAAGSRAAACSDGAHAPVEEQEALGAGHAPSHNGVL